MRASGKQTIEDAAAIAKGGMEASEADLAHAEAGTRSNSVGGLRRCTSSRAE